MSGLLLHSPAAIVADLLVQLGLGIDFDSSGDWKVFISGEPPDPDRIITVFDDPGRDSGRTHPQGVRLEHHGIRIQIRADTHAVGYPKARAIAVALDTTVYQETVTIDGTVYQVHSISRTSDVLALGKDAGSRRNLFSITAIAALFTAP